MTTPHLIMWGVVLAVGIPASWKNPTALALVIAWLAAETMFLLTGNSLPISFYLFPDIFVLAVIMAKHEHVCHHPYKSGWHQLWCCLFERSPCDRVIVLIFLAMWCLYVADVHPYYKWWALYYLAVAQFLVAGLESFLIIIRRAHTAASDTSETTSGDECRVAWSRGYG